ncbi:MAG: hypothetical protein V1742_02835 [Pseudomonadota bacterium]
MGGKIRMIFMCLLLLGWLLVLVQPAAAVGVWWEGTVTQGPWVEKDQRMLGVNNVTFSLMADATIYERTNDYSGISHQNPISFESIRPGQKVLVRIQGHRIHQVIVLE